MQQASSGVVAQPVNAVAQSRSVTGPIAIIQVCQRVEPLMFEFARDLRSIGTAVANISAGAPR